MKASNGVVYWIHLESHTDILKEGYVGVTCDFESRMKRHLTRTARSDNHFGRAIIMYGWINLVKEVVFTGTKEECFQYENKLRPDYQIGWNEAIGGEYRDNSPFIDYQRRINKGWSYDKTGSKNPFFGKKHTPESRRKNSEAQSTTIIYSEHGTFYGFNSLARFLNVHKATAKKLAIRKGWKIEDKQKGIRVN